MTDPDCPGDLNEAERIDRVAQYLRERLDFRADAKLAIVLGSGLGAFADQLQDAVAVTYEEIPHFPVSAVPGHAGRLVAGQLGGMALLVMQGRVHAYEGHSANAVTFPVRTLAALGVRALILTNAAGAIRLNLRQGQLVLLLDHINLSGLNPAAGPLLRDRPRFFDMSEAYSRRLRGIAQEVAFSLGGAELPEGVYVSVLGPSFETPAEIRAFRAMGADLVGMSTALETIAARQAGMEVLGISCVTNMAAGIEAAPLNHEEVMETGQAVEQQLGALLAGVSRRMRALFDQDALQEPTPDAD
jgi:purine-nucleoside phosphorylase